MHPQDNYFRLLFTDHLGSVRTAVCVHLPESWDWKANWSGYAYYDNYPYGPIWWSSQPGGSVSYKYTGKLRDASGLDYFGARYYAVSDFRMRWISADSVTARVYDPPSLNKYTYVRDDPVNFVDPDGHFRMAVQWKSWWFYDPPSSSNGGGRAGQTRSGGQGGGGFGNGGPTIVTHSWLVDWFPSFFNIDTSISTATRQQVLSDALIELANRIDREDCRAFLQGVIDKLKANQVLKKEISSPAFGTTQNIPGFAWQK